MKRDYKEDSVYMQHKLDEILNDLWYAHDDLSMQINIPKKNDKELSNIEKKISKLLQDMKKGV